MKGLAITLSLLMAAPAAAQSSHTATSPNSTTSYSNYSNNGPADWERQRDLAAMGPRRQSGNPPQISEAKRLVGAMKLNCDLVDAALLGRTKDRSSGAPVEVTTYEVACRDDFGWIITTRADGGGTAFDCLALMTSAKAAGKGWNTNAVCLLGANASSIPGLRALAKKIGAPCQVEAGTFMGQGGAPPIARYELLCQEGGYIVDNPTPGSTAAFQSFPCAAAKTAGVTCALEHKKAG